MSRQPQRIPLHVQIARELRRKIARSGKAGDRLDSEAGLAKQFNTSSLTVREALSQLAQDGVIERRHGSGTYILDPLARQHVGILFESDISHPRTSYMARRALQQVRRLITRAGLKVRLYLGDVQPGQDSPQLTCSELLDDLDEGRLCGIAAILTSPNPSQWCKRATEQGVPVIGGGEGFPLRVDTDANAIFRMGVRRLHELGRTRIALMGWGGHGDRAPAAFRRAMTEAGITVHPEWIRVDLHPSAEGAGWEEFRDIWSAHRDQKPNGLIITDDMLVTDTAAAIQDLAIKVPEELAVVAHGSRGGLVQTPFPADRIVFDPDAYAQLTADLLLQAIHGQVTQATCPALKPELLWDQSRPPLADVNE